MSPFAIDVMDQAAYFQESKYSLIICKHLSRGRERERALIGILRTDITYFRKTVVCKKNKIIEPVRFIIRHKNVL